VTKGRRALTKEESSVKTQSCVGLLPFVLDQTLDQTAVLYLQWLEYKFDVIRPSYEGGGALRPGVITDSGNKISCGKNICSRYKNAYFSFETL